MAQRSRRAPLCMCMHVPLPAPLPLFDIASCQPHSVQHWQAAGRWLGWHPAAGRPWLPGCRRRLFGSVRSGDAWCTAPRRPQRWPPATRRKPLLLLLPPHHTLMRPRLRRCCSGCGTGRRSTGATPSCHARCRRRHDCCRHWLGVCLAPPCQPLLASCDTNCTRDCSCTTGARRSRAGRMGARDAAGAAAGAPATARRCGPGRAWLHMGGGCDHRQVVPQPARRPTLQGGQPG